MVTFAKGLGNGLALAGVVARPEMMDCIQANSISTFGGNPLACAGGLANLEHLLSHDLQTNARKVGEHLVAHLRELGDRIPSIGEVRGKGLMIGIELVEPGGKKPDLATAAAVMEETKARGLLVGKGGLYNNVLRLAPPLSVTLEEADEGLRLLTDSFEAVTIGR